MKNIKVKNIGENKVVYDIYHYEQKQELKNFLESQEIKDILNNISENVIMVLGGDGTMLRAIKKYYEEEKPFLPINYGSVGFLLNDKNFINKNSSFIKRTYPLLDIKVKTENRLYNDIAFNEMLLGNIKDMLDFNIKINNDSELNLQGNGLIISTPAGSTGYNSSLYGPILPHSLNGFIITYIAAWRPEHQPSTILENSSIINIKNQNRKYETTIAADGREIIKTKENQDFEIIVKKSKYKVKILIEKSYKNTWDNKVLSKQGFHTISQNI